MAGTETVALLVLRVIAAGERYVIRIQDLRTGEMREFSSWNELRRYAEKEALHTRLR